MQSQRSREYRFGSFRNRLLRRYTVDGCTPSRPTTAVTDKPQGQLLGRNRMGKSSCPSGYGNTAEGSIQAWQGARSIPADAGNTFVDNLTTVWPTGPSPRMRGTLSLTTSRRFGRPVHPRGCGEYAYPANASAKPGGPSPRMRGIRVAASSSSSANTGPSPRMRGIQTGPTPYRGRRSVHPRGCGEYAPLKAIAARILSVHPRGCGEYPTITLDQVLGDGPSPRMRGIQGDDRAELRRVRSIPADAGNTRWLKPARISRHGPSPRMRGIHAMPATRSRCSTVHPRGCGEYEMASNRVAQANRSIPADAGNTKTIAGEDDIAARSIPADAGNTTVAVEPFGSIDGPSPRMRGIRISVTKPNRQSRSIPADAGNTDSAPVSPRHSPGPSPRMRGIRDAAVSGL